MINGGYAGYLLDVDLTTAQAVRSPLPERYIRRNLGGKALAAQLLWDRMNGSEIAFSEENLVIVAAAPLTGTEAVGTARFDVAALSPKDGSPAFSNCGGNLGVHLKQSGYDALILRGKSAQPLWLEISGQNVVFRDGRELWGQNTGQCRETLIQRLQTRKIASLCIGPAGEHLVKFASLAADGHSTGRAGLGAVLGWKNLKAIAVSGERELPKGNAQGAYCRNCPIHCVRIGRDGESVLNELGLDAVAAEAARKWAAEHGLPTDTIYEDIAFRRGMGDYLAEGVESRKGGKRRKDSYGQIAAFFDLPQEEASTGEFCRNFAEAISVCGQCMFTVRGLVPGTQELPLLTTLRHVTGQEWTIQKLLALGAYSRNLEEQLKERFHTSS